MKELMAQHDTRLDKFIKEHFTHLSRSKIARLISSGKVRLNGKKAKKGDMVFRGDRVSVEMSELLEDFSIQPDESISLKTLYSDERVICIEKPGFTHTLPLKKGERGTVANYIVAKFPECKNVRHPLNEDLPQAGILYRLDYKTSGVIVAAREQEAMNKLFKLQESGKIKKTYIARVMGSIEDPVEIKKPIFLLKGRGKKVYTEVESLKFKARVRKVYQARTAIYPVRTGEDTSLVAAVVTRATRHQVRAHLSSMGWPILGDEIYGNYDENEPLNLHLYRVDVAGDFVVQAGVPQWAKELMDGNIDLNY